MTKVTTKVAVFLLEHAYEADECEQFKLIGLYATRKDAYATVRKLRKYPGFKDHPKGFNADSEIIRLLFRDSFAPHSEKYSPPIPRFIRR